MAHLFDTGIFSVEGLAGEILVGAKLAWFEAGTTTPLATYSDPGLTTPNTNPVVANAAGRFPPIWLQVVSYKYVLTDADDVVLVTRDNITVDNLRGDLASPTGATLIGFRQTGAGGIDSTVDAKLKQFLPTAQDRGAAIDGATDTRADLLEAEANGPFQLTAGLYYVSASVTLNNLYYMAPGARLVIPNGCIVTAPNLDAGEYQIVNLTVTGNLGGLPFVRAAWFVGDKIGTTTDATAMYQKAVNAGARMAAVRLHSGDICIDGGTAIVVNNGQQLTGSGRRSSRFLFTSSARNCFLFTTEEGGQLQNATFQQHPSQNAVVATSGTAVLFDGVGAVNSSAVDIFIANCWRGLIFQNGNSTMAARVFASGAMDIGIGVINHQNPRFIDCHSSAFTDWFTLSSTSGFIAGESVSWTGGNGSYGYTQDGTKAQVVINKVRPANGATITGATSGTVATVVSTQAGHASGGIYGYGHCEAADLTNCSAAGGTFAAQTDAAVNAHGSRPEYWNLTGCYFDNSDNGARFRYSPGFSFVSQWAASRQGSGITLLSSPYAHFSNPKLVNNWIHGLYADEMCQGLTVNGGEAFGNNVSTFSSGDGIRLAANLTDYSITGIRAGGGYLGALQGPQRYGVCQDAGTSDRYVIDILGGGNVTGGIFDGGSGVTKFIRSIGG